MDGETFPDIYPTEPPYIEELASGATEASSDPDNYSASNIEVLKYALRHGADDALATIVGIYTFAGGVGASIDYFRETNASIVNEVYTGSLLALGTVALTAITSLYTKAYVRSRMNSRSAKEDESNGSQDEALSSTIKTDLQSKKV